MDGWMDGWRERAKEREKEIENSLSASPRREDAGLRVAAHVGESVLLYRHAQGASGHRSTRDTSPARLCAIAGWFEPGKTIFPGITHRPPDLLVGALFEQQADSLEVPVLAGNIQRRASVLQSQM